MSKKLYKSRTDSKVDGVCGGIAEYFGIDSTIVRLAWIFFCCLSGSGVVAYVLCAFIIPRGPLPDNNTYYEPRNPNAN